MASALEGLSPKDVTKIVRVFLGATGMNGLSTISSIRNLSVCWSVRASVRFSLPAAASKLCFS